MSDAAARTAGGAIPATKNMDAHLRHRLIEAAAAVLRAIDPGIDQPIIVEIQTADGSECITVRSRPGELDQGETVKAGKLSEMEDRCLRLLQSAGKPLEPKAVASRAGYHAVWRVKQALQSLASRGMVTEHMGHFAAQTEARICPE